MARPLTGLATSRRALCAHPGDHEVDIVGPEFVVVTEMGPNLVDELPCVVVDPPTAPTHHVEMVVGVGDLPTSSVIDPEM